jgi:hypothetical protein
MIMKHYTGTILLAVVMGFVGATEAQALSVTFDTNGPLSVFSSSGTNIATFIDGAFITRLTFVGAPSSTVTTPAGASFGEIDVFSTEPPGALGPMINGTLTLHFDQTSPLGMGMLVGNLSGNLGSNTGIAQLTFTTTMVTIAGVTYNVNPLYTIALPSAGGKTTVQGNITAVPENGNTLILLGAALLGLVAVQRRLKAT